MYTKILALPGRVLVALLFLEIAACSRSSPAPFSSPAADTPRPTLPSGSAPSQTPFQPTPTSPALAAEVNGSALTREDYQAELARYRRAVGRDLTPDDQAWVLNDLIDQMLLAQGAEEAGFHLDPGTVQAHIDQLTTQVGGAPALANWMADNGYQEESFRQDLARSISAAWMRDQISVTVPLTAEQVHARQILLVSQDEANQVLAQLQSGSDFATLAAQYDPVTEGDLGWFPRGTLPDPALEAAAFSLEPKQFSPVVQTQAGYVILQVSERDPQRPLEPEARLALQAQAIQAWLQTRRQQSEIQVMLP